MSRPQAPPVMTRRWRGGAWAEAGDRLAAEEPLQVSLDGEPLSVIMRTPGNDLELTIGLLFAERVIGSLGDVGAVHISAETAEQEQTVELFADLIESNQVDVRLRTAGGRRPERSFLSSSACGVCGATTVESLALAFPALEANAIFDPAVLTTLPAVLRDRQMLFEQTGGLHAAGLFTGAGELLVLREDVGRHNAVDKVVGRCLLDGLIPASQHMLLVSGRAGYEVVQKAVAAGIPLLAAVGAPTTLAVATAAKFHMTLAGFLRNERFNVYSAAERLGSPVK